MSNMRDWDITCLIEELEQSPDKIIDPDKLRELPHRNDEKPGEISSVSRKRVLEALVPPPSSGIITPVRKADT